MNPATRREALILIAASAPSLSAQQHHHDHPEEAPQPTRAYQPRTLTKSEMDLVATLTDLIIPRTETPGASDAGVPEFIDRRLTASADLTRVFRSGLSLLDRGFAKFPPERQVTILTDMGKSPESERGRFFRLLKELTVDGYYSSHAGLVEELGWHGNTYLTEFKGCTHPEHQS
jgi:Gluconate 2-dehydrogenase subunit 3